MRFVTSFFILFVTLFPCLSVQAQQDDLSFLTIERPPFAFERGGEATGFSIELMRLIAQEIDTEVSFTFVDEFPDLLDGVVNGAADGAVANISITSERETALDFSSSIYGSGLKILVSGAASSTSIWAVVLRWDLLALVLAGFGALFLLGLLMWLFERRQQGYFQLEGRKALFPAFWWALNLVLNGGFEVNMPRTILGRLLGVLMVVSSLFVVSLFVANITAALTVDAISGSIRSLNDLEGRRVGTTEGSTASLFLDERGIAHATYQSFDALMDEFEHQELDAVVFDAPILAYYLTTEATGEAYLLDRVFRAEDYGIALAQGSALREPINRALLRLTEGGEYQTLRRDWFGDAP